MGVIYLSDGREFTRTLTTPQAATTYLASQGVNNIVGYTESVNKFNNMIYDYEPNATNSFKSGVGYAILEPDMAAIDDLSSNDKILTCEEKLTVLSPLTRNLVEGTRVGGKKVYFSGVFPSDSEGEDGDICIIVPQEGTFLYDGSDGLLEFSFQKGMTWEQFVNSSYNTNNYFNIYNNSSSVFHNRIRDNHGYDLMGYGSTSVFKYNYVIPNGDYGPSYCCFEAGTQILINLQGETKSIEELGRGDNVISYNVETGEYYNAECTNLIINKNTIDIAEITFKSGNKLKMNAYHPIYCEGGFKSLTNFNDYPTLELNDKAICYQGNYDEIIDINRYQLDEPMITYNLSLRDYNEYLDDDTNDTYIANGVVVHNAPCLT